MAAVLLVIVLTSVIVLPNHPTAVCLLPLPHQQHHGDQPRLVHLSVQASRFFWLNLVVGFCFLLLVGLIAIPFAAGFWHLFQESQNGAPLDIPLMLSLVLPLIPIIILIALAAFLSDMILRDWMLPHFALDDASAGEAWSQVWVHIKAEKKQFFVYTLLRIALPIVAAVGLFMLLAIPGLILGGAFAAVEFGIHSTFADATGASLVVGILLQVFFGILAVGFAVLAGICLGGPVSTAIREYALIFYGGRYKQLGDALYPESQRRPWGAGPIAPLLQELPMLRLRFRPLFPGTMRTRGNLSRVRSVQVNRGPASASRRHRRVPLKLELPQVEVS